MECARCGSSLHKVPMYDLPRRVSEFACMCCGERFWTIEGSIGLFQDESEARHALKKKQKLELSTATPGQN